MNIDNIGIGTSAASLAVSAQGANASAGSGFTPVSGEASLVSVGREASFISITSKKVSTSDTLSMVAVNIRVADKTMDYINSEIIAKMKKQLETIVKQYPPYPPGSQERVKFLKNYAGLRKMIEQLTIPPEYQFAHKILSSSSSSQTPGAGDQTVKVGNGSRSVTIRNQDISPGPDGLDIPVLSTSSSDAEIAQAYDKISAAEVKINTKRDSLASDAQTLATSIEFANLPTDITEQDAMQNSITVRSTLYQHQLSITNSRTLSVLIS